MPAATRATPAPTAIQPPPERLFRFNPRISSAGRPANDRVGLRPNLSAIPSPNWVCTIAPPDIRLMVGESVSATRGLASDLPPSGSWNRAPAKLPDFWSNPSYVAADASSGTSKQLAQARGMTKLIMRLGFRSAEHLFQTLSLIFRREIRLRVNCLYLQPNMLRIRGVPNWPLREGAALIVCGDQKHGSAAHAARDRLLAG